MNPLAKEGLEKVIASSMARRQKRDELAKSMAETILASGNIGSDLSSLAKQYLDLIKSSKSQT